ncbi:DUF4391 domain-containing protein [Rhizobium metallidurans]|uniref:DUF4391 domain-containing protein n=1 Tax=Rhizobium metallidurans TaxID=1265931 RepID=A0A7W6CVL1_9HYPH|nr:hypothetical protein [Rhizobium metallidurans]
MSAFFDYPEAASFGRVVPKNKIYEHAGATKALKDLYITQVDQITWMYKLAPETINLAAVKSVAEIQIFSITLRTGKLDHEVLRAIDRAIPFPLIFEILWAGKRQVVAAFKRPSEADSTKWVVSDYFESEWVPEELPRQTLPVALNLGALYEKLLTALMSAEMPTGEDIKLRVARLEAVRAKRREIERIKVRLEKEKQFNKRVAINAELRIENLKLEEILKGE